MAKRVMFDVASGVRVSVVGTAWRGIGQQDRCLIAASQPKTGGQNRKGRARWPLAGVSLDNSANQSRRKWRGDAGPSHFSLTTVSRVSRVSLSSLGPGFFRTPTPSIACRGLHQAFHDDTITAPLGRVTGPGCRCTADLAC